MDRSMILICILCGAYLLYLGAEKVCARRYRRSLHHVVQVNGIRGKSSTVRLITAGLRAGGHRVAAKSTGTLPELLHADGREELIVRRAPSNIREQLYMLRTAFREKADVLVCECMAITPELQRASQQMLQADLAVITNVRIDHTDVMGDTRAEICDSLLSMAPEGGLLFTGERDMLPRMQAAMEKLGGQAVLAEPPAGGYPGVPDFPENVAVALAVCKAVGVDEAVALRGMAGVKKDPYAFERVDIGDLTFLNAFSANDTLSTRMLYERSGAKGRLILLLNNRKDRSSRAGEMARLAKLLSPAEIWVMGEQRCLLMGLLRRACPGISLRAFSDPDDIPLSFPEPTVLLGAGNIKGHGERFTQRIRNTERGQGS